MSKAASNPTVKYAKIFNEEFNLSFGYPKSDTCGQCDQLKHQISSFTDKWPEKALLKKERITQLGKKNDPISGELYLPVGDLH